MGQKRAYSPRKSWLREAVIADLRLNGPAEDEKGRALHVLTERVGHHSSMSVGNVIRELEAEGKALRVNAEDGTAPRDAVGNPSPHVRRTYRVTLTDEFIATLPTITAPEAKMVVNPEPQPGVEAEVTAEVEESQPEAGTLPGGLEVPAGLDYQTFTDYVMAVVFDGLQSKSKYAGVIEELEKTKFALAEAKQVIDALGAELKAERKERGKIEDDAAKLSAEVEELALQAKKSGRNNGWDRVPVDAYKELDKIMRAVPTARG